MRNHLAVILLCVILGAAAAFFLVPSSGVDAPEKPSSIKHTSSLVSPDTPIVAVNCGDRPCYVYVDRETKSYIVQFMDGDTWTIKVNDK